MKNLFMDKDTGSIADLVPFLEGMLITRINVPKIYRGQGHGSAILQEILEEADKTVTTLYLQISPSGGLSYGQLRAWYERHGFKQTQIPKWGPHWVRAPKHWSGSI